jgi:hypothetical protein
MLLAYAVEGRKTIQSTSLDTILTFVAAGLLIAAGGKFLWNVEVETIVCYIEFH